MHSYVDCGNIVQINHRFKTKLQRRIYGHAIDAAIRPLNEDKAVQAAADLVGELFVFTVIFSSKFSLIKGVFEILITTAYLIIAILIKSIISFQFGWCQLIIIILPF